MKIDFLKGYDLAHQNDRGIDQISEFDFVCTLSMDGWENAIDLALPFSEHDGMNGFQWLFNLDTGIDLLLSRNGKW